jgi:hypothetical protein
MATNPRNPERASSDGPVADLDAAIRLVSRGLARRVTIAGLQDAEAAAAAVAGPAGGVSIEVIAPHDPATSAWAIRVTRATAVASAALPVHPRGDIDERPSLLMTRPAPS